VNLLIAQARMGSSRLPGKVLRPVNDKSMLENLVERISPSSTIGKIVVATTTNSEDDAIEALCAKRAWAVYRGSDWDVLDRFYNAAVANNAQSGDNIVRICCDNALHSHQVVDFVVGEFLKLGVDYFSNSNQEPDFLEDGFDVEVTTFNALATAWKEAKMMSQREHVMPYIKDSGKFSLAWRKAHSKYNFKLSVDTENDLKVSQAIFSSLAGNPDFSIDEVVDLLEKKPEILDLNKDSEINSGYKKSLSEDKEIS